MKIVKPISLVLALTLPALSFADCNFVSGGYQMGTSFDGPTACTGTVDSVVVQGPLSLNQATMNSVSVNGSVTANHSTVQALDMNGGLKSQDSSFGNINANGDLYFSHSSVKNITIKKAALVGSYKIYLDSTSVVSGNITFKEGAGIIYKSKGAKILGKITGATVENQ